MLKTGVLPLGADNHRLCVRVALGIAHTAYIDLQWVHLGFVRFSIEPCHERVERHRSKGPGCSVHAG